MVKFIENASFGTIPDMICALSMDYVALMTSWKCEWRCFIKWNTIGSMIGKGKKNGYAVLVYIFISSIFLSIESICIKRWVVFVKWSWTWIFAIGGLWGHCHVSLNASFITKGVLKDVFVWFMGRAKERKRKCWEK